MCNFNVVLIKNVHLSCIAQRNVKRKLLTVRGQYIMDVLYCMAYAVSLWTTLTVWAFADNGVRCTGVCLLLRLSHNTIWPQYVPPTIKLGWNRANIVDMTPDWKIKKGIHSYKLQHTNVCTYTCNCTVKYQSKRHFNLPYRMQSEVVRVSSTKQRTVFTKQNRI